VPRLLPWTRHRLLLLATLGAAASLSALAQVVIMRNFIISININISIDSLSLCWRRWGPLHRCLRWRR